MEHERRVGVQVDMDAFLNYLLHVQIRPWIAYAVRSRLGNALVIANAFYLARAAILQYAFNCSHANCTLVGDPIEFSVCYSTPSFTTALYHLAHVPTWLAISFVEWVLEPGWDQLFIATARHIEAALFVWLSCVQWLFIGAFVENRVSRALQRVARRAELAQAPEPPSESSSFTVDAAGRAR